MAGGKQTPRQRMINLMYLVLTAMLALQVSSSIMDKFIFLNNSLEHALEGAKEASENALKSLKDQVKKEGNTQEGLERIKRAEELKKETAKMIGEIDKIKRKLVDEAGGGIDAKTGGVKDPKEETKVEVIMIGQAGANSGRAYDLEKKLNTFVDHLNTEYKDLQFTKPFEKLAYGNKDVSFYQNDPIQKNKDFANANFGQTPVVAALAILTQKQNEIIRYEQEVLKKLGAGEFGKEIKFDKIVAMASADANIVAAGNEYKAEMFISASSSQSGAVMTYNGSPLKPNEDGVGLVKFTATGRGEQSWEGKITIKNRGRDTTFTFNKKYMVVEPVLLVMAKSKFPLYRNCANPLETSVPALGAAYSPTFSVNNGTAIPGSALGDVTLFPGAGPTCSLTVSSGGKTIGSVEFRVNPVPPPTIYIGNRNGARINVKDPLPPANLSVVAESDETFRNTLPKEANYRVAAIEVFQFRGGRSIANKRFAAGAFDVQAFQPKPGDGFQVNVVSVQRINSKGQIEEAKITTPFLAFFVR